jgi:hypothetical protein
MRDLVLDRRTRVLTAMVGVHCRGRRAVDGHRLAWCPGRPVPGRPRPPCSADRGHPPRCGSSGASKAAQNAVADANGLGRSAGTCSRRDRGVC